MDGSDHINRRVRLDMSIKEVTKIPFVTGTFENVIETFGVTFTLP
jgi:hypothetical protein